jgi:hypothetical protein
MKKMMTSPLFIFSSWGKTLTSISRKQQTKRQQTPWRAAWSRKSLPDDLDTPAPKSDGKFVTVRFPDLLESMNGESYNDYDILLEGGFELSWSKTLGFHWGIDLCWWSVRKKVNDASLLWVRTYLFYVASVLTFSVQAHWREWPQISRFQVDLLHLRSHLLWPCVGK